MAQKDQTSIPTRTHRYPSYSPHGPHEGDRSLMWDNRCSTPRTLLGVLNAKAC